MIEIGRYINAVSKKLQHTVEGIDNGFDLSNVSLHVLGYLAHHDEVYQGDFEKVFHIRRSSISSILSNLESKGYIERYTDTVDTRRKRVVLTTLGKEVEKATFLATIGKVEQKMNECLTEEEQVALINILTKLAASLDEIQREGLDD